jgi:hypothetical protein
VAESGGLLNRCTGLNLYPGFESLPHRQLSCSSHPSSPLRLQKCLRHSGPRNRSFLDASPLSRDSSRKVVMGNVPARKNRTLLHPEARAEILRRIEVLTPRSERRWGRMTPHQMVCHLSDACRAAFGERRVPVIGTLWERDQVLGNTHECQMAAGRQDRAGGRSGNRGHSSNRVCARRR